ncbi:hypothetical protein FKR81_32050 [Lentzea tibetensis]|uniref:PknH-like extracellular domain-containing protein n=1 Tax=Lentzea tibetensis TaxID=2591470 RepID=A0A563EKP8_9PSEU|nr:hypothetical protein [Lentzea tibetensis]TWP47592.1 hypothetical protein FKR81_32050 [Lentzea tibetensis]
MTTVRWCGVLLVLTACASGSAEPPVGAIPVVRTGADIVLPLDRFQQTSDRRELLSKAVDVVGDRCMRRFGLEWKSDPAPQPSLSNTGRYTNLDPAVASADGYHSRAAGGPPPSALPADAKAVWLGEGVTAYRGVPVPSGGCVGEAMRQLKPGIEQIEAGLPQKLQWQSFALTRQDSRVTAAFARWASCMQDKGFRYPDPPTAANDPRWRTERPSPQETATAVADVDCKLRTNVAGVMLAVETAYQQRLADENAGALAAVMAYADRELAIARQVVQG